MKILILFVLFIIFLSFPKFLAAKTAPSCYSHPGGSYCQYNGYVRQIYVNSGNLILMYFEKALDVSVAADVGLDVTNGGAGMIKISDNPEFAKMFYSTALAAQASKRKVIVQLRRSGSYLTIDRIWLDEERVEN